MPITYSTELEEIAAHKDAAALRQAAKRVLSPEELAPGRRDQTFFELGHRFGDRELACFTWHGDGESLLVFAEGGGRGPIRGQVRRVKDVDPEDMR